MMTDEEMQKKIDDVNREIIRQRDEVIEENRELVTRGLSDVGYNAAQIENFFKEYKREVKKGLRELHQQCFINAVNRHLQEKTEEPSALPRP